MLTGDLNDVQNDVQNDVLSLSSNYYWLILIGLHLDITYKDPSRFNTLLSGSLCKALEQATNMHFKVTFKFHSLLNLVQYGTRECDSSQFLMFKVSHI